MNIRKYGLIALALAVVTGGLIRYGAIAGSVPEAPSAVSIVMPAAQSLNLTVNGQGRLSLGSDEPTFGGLVHNTQESFDAGIAVQGVQVLSSSGALSLGAGTSIDKHVRATVTVNPQSISAGGSTTTVVTLTGASTGDHCLVNSTSGDLLSTTSTAVLACRITAADAATVYYYNATSTAAFDAGSSVLSVQAWSY